MESTFNWYWLVDGLMDVGYPVHLANPAAMKEYKGLKHKDDKKSALWLANLLRLKILPEGYIYPKEERPVRDLLRKRLHLAPSPHFPYPEHQEHLQQEPGKHDEGRRHQELMREGH